MGNDRNYLEAHFLHIEEQNLHKNALKIRRIVILYNTFFKDFFKGLIYWQHLTSASNEDSYLLYGGEQNQIRSNARALGWKSIADIFSD